MIEVLWHGRGGQGAFTAARLLGAAASLDEGRWALAFPSFGPERRGAPMRSVTKMGDRPIGDRSAIAAADYVVYLDETLLGPGWADELKPGGRVLVNSARGREAFPDERIVPLDADGLSARLLGRPIPNTVFLGALCALCDAVDEPQVGEAIRRSMPARLHEGNLAIVGEARRAVQAMLDAAHTERASELDLVDLADAQAPLAQAVEGGFTESDDAAGEGDDACAHAADRPEPTAAPARRPCLIPTLRTDPLPPPDEYAATTCFQAGCLTDRNAGWRNIRPVVGRDACTGCLQCYLYCPDGAIYKTGADPKDADRPCAPVAVDYDFCKGCGVCATVCSFGALAMVPEHGGEGEGVQRRPSGEPVREGGRR